MTLIADTLRRNGGAHVVGIMCNPAVARIPRPSHSAAMTSICFSRGRVFTGPIHEFGDWPTTTLEGRSKSRYIN